MSEAPLYHTFVGVGGELVSRNPPSVEVQGYLARNNAPLGPYSRTMPRALWWC